MTTPQHGIQSGIIAYLIYPRMWFILIAIILGIFPDICRLLQKNPLDWNLYYRWAHRNWYCFLLPFWNLHIIEDYFIHKPEGGWQWWGIYIEVTFWLIEGAIFVNYWLF